DIGEECPRISLQHLFLRHALRAQGLSDELTAVIEQPGLGFDQTADEGHLQARIGRKPWRSPARPPSANPEVAPIRPNGATLLLLYDDLPGKQRFIVTWRELQTVTDSYHVVNLEVDLVGGLFLHQIGDGF